MVIIQRKHFEDLFTALKKRGYDVIAPTIQDGAIVYDAIDSSAEMPIGWGDEQSPGKYRLKKRRDEALFGYVVGPTAWKKFLFPSQLKLWQAQRHADGFDIQPEKMPSKKMAFIGARSCELQAMAIQDKVFIGGSYKDSQYLNRRKDCVIIAVNCTKPGGTCFCVSMNTGPKAISGFDLVLTEVLTKEEHYFIVESGSDFGKILLKDIPHRLSKKPEQEQAEALIERAKKQMGRTMDTQNIKALLQDNPEHPQWDQVAERCLSCANCTMVCPTCFCSTVEDVTDLTGDHTERWRYWDSCFNLDYSYIHGGHVRKTTKGRYRQWLTHKLASWHDQFDSSGCVGCGRCVTWCPVGIDLTEEVKAIRGTAFLK